LFHLLVEVGEWGLRALAIPGAKSSWKYGTRQWWRREFKKVFGTGVQDCFLGCGSLQINPAIPSALGITNPLLSKFPFVKPGRQEMSFSAQRVANVCELRAVSYIGSALSIDGGRSSKVVDDELIATKLDVDFISFGAMNNLATINAFDNPANRFVDYDLEVGFFVSKKDRRPLCVARTGYDYGVILKLHPSQFPKRTWIVCGGIGEWGTSGSAWFLAHKWRSLAGKLVGDDQFACVIELRPGQDESAVLREFLH
jgi:hypothetical protein